MSEQPKFTPGPWEVAIGGRNARDRLYTTVRRAVPTERRNVIASIGVGRVRDSVDTANAHLIAAAPEMYAALEGLLAHLRGEAGYSTAHHKAVAALAKARGEQP